MKVAQRQEVSTICADHQEVENEKGVVEGGGGQAGGIPGQGRESGLEEQKSWCRNK